MFIYNKYKKWHDNIIAKAQNRTLEGYKEMHHIIPKSCGGTNDKSNLVALTAREHYIIHVLLTYCIITRYKFKMIKALNCISNMRTKYLKRDFKYSSKLYEKNKKMYSEYMKLNNPSHSEEVRRKISQTKTGVKRAESIVLKMIGRKLSKETKLKISKALMGNTRRLNTVIPLEQRKKQSKFMMGNKLNLGRKFSDKTKLKMALSHKQRWILIRENRRVA